MNGVISWNTVTGLWIMFVAYWAISALKVRRTDRTESAGASFATVTVLGVAAVLIFSRRIDLGPRQGRFLPESPWVQGVAIVMVAAGIGIAIWARWHMGEFWSARVTLKEDHQLIQSGPYARVRHPIYSGILLAMLGTALFSGEWRALVGVALVFLAHWQKARREERLLEEQFGAGYTEYRKCTGSLLPRWR